MNDAPKYWFPAKRYGWGWGLPTTWQGWIVLAGFFVLLAIGTFWLLPGYGALGFSLYTGGVTASLIIICWRKGEPPRWRWGEGD